MPDSIKISELPILSSVRAGDILPVVDENITQTSRCTAAQIAAIGGGPPGDGTVTTAKIVNGAVTAAKTSFSATDKILGRASSGAGNGEEITCTSWARGLLACVTNNAAVAYLSELLTFASATFTGTSTFTGPIVSSGGISSSGQITAAGGSASAPSYSFTGDTNCGISQLGGADTIGMVTSGVERFRVDANGNLSSVIATVSPASTLYPGVLARASCTADMATMNSTNICNVSSVQRPIDPAQTGYIRVNFATPMPDLGYAAHGTASVFGYGTNAALFCIEHVKTTGYVQFFTASDSNQRVDTRSISVTIFR